MKDKYRGIFPLKLSNGTFKSGIGQVQHENMDVNEYKKEKHEFSEVICCDLITPVLPLYCT